MDAIGSRVHLEQLGMLGLAARAPVIHHELLRDRPGLIAFAQAARAASRRIASICTGAFVLAEAGMLDGKRATTHWILARELQRDFPQVKVEEDRIFIIDGDVTRS
jgi:transcriptional regulator GlxA family with amidase domain